MNPALDSTPEAILWTVGLFVVSAVLLVLAGLLVGVWLGTSQRRPEDVVRRRAREGQEQRRQWRDAR